MKVLIGLLIMVIGLSSCDYYSSDYPRTLYERHDRYDGNRRVIQLNDSIIIDVSGDKTEVIRITGTV